MSQYNVHYSQNIEYIAIAILIHVAGPKLVGCRRRWSAQENVHQAEDVNDVNSPANKVETPDTSGAIGN